MSYWMKIDLDNIPEEKGFRRRIHIIIFGSDTLAGKLFDIVLIAAIALSVAVVMLDSIGGIRANFGDLLWKLEWFFTFLLAWNIYLELHR